MKTVKCLVLALLTLIGAESADSVLGQRRDIPRTSELVEEFLSTRAVKILLTSADSVNGIQGFVTDDVGKPHVRFRSKVRAGVLRAEIWTAEGGTLAEYTEGITFPVRITLSSGEVFEYTKDNSLVVGGVVTDNMYVTADNREKNLQVWKSIATSYEGHLLRKLALELVDEAGGEHLVKERRGLELPFQAIQDLYELQAGQVVETEDYLYSPPSGFVVKTQPSNLLLSKNYLAGFAGGEEHHSFSWPDSAQSDYLPLDDGSQVGDCYGRCGGGCGDDWDHEWVGTPTRLEVIGSNGCELQCPAPSVRQELV